MVGFLVAPLLALAGALPSTRPLDLVERGTVQALSVSVLAATVAMIADAILGIPLALWLARSEKWWRHLITAVVLLPLGIPPVVGGLVLLLWLGPQGWLRDLSPINTVAGTILAQMFVAAPFVVISARAAFLAVDRELEDAARSLGCTASQAVRRVVLPAARRGLAAGVVLGWVRCLGEFGATAIVSYHPYTLPTLTFVRLTGEGIATALPTGALVGLVGAAAALGLLALDAARIRRRPHAEVEERTPAVSLAWVQPSVSERTGISVDVRLDLRRFLLHVAFSAPSGTIAILGPSGAGKTLTLRAIAGLIQPDNGRIQLGGRVLFDSTADIDLPPEHRKLGYVSQRESLFDHLDVEGNVAFAVSGLNAAERGRRVEELLRALGLGSVRHAMPRNLSGGEHRRAVVARALATAPAALLLDEPFSAIDVPLRGRVRRLIRELFDRTQLPVILVTHDREDVLDLADYVIVLEHGHAVQSGAVDEVFRHPVNRSVAALLGIPNVLQVHGLSGGRDGRVRARTRWGEFEVEAPLGRAGGWEVAVPADAVMVDPVAEGALIAAARPGSTGWRVWLSHEAGAEPLEAMVPRSVFARRPALASSCGVTIEGSRCHLMPIGSV